MYDKITACPGNAITWTLMQGMNSFLIRWKLKVNLMSVLSSLEAAQVFDKLPSQQIGVHEESLYYVLPVLEILCSSTKLTFVLTLCAWCVFHACVWLCFFCVSFEFTLGSCVFTFGLRCYRAHGELKRISNQHIPNTTNPEHTLAPICWDAANGHGDNKIDIMTLPGF